jgi:hypothetical protein
VTQPKVREIDIRQTDVHTLTAGGETNFETLESHKWPGINQIPAEAIRTGDEPLQSHIHKLI